MSKIYGNATGGFGFPKTFVLTDKDGNEFTGVVTEQKTVFTATKDDVKTGKIFASDEGIQTGVMKDCITISTKLWSYIKTANSDKTDSELASLIGLTSEELSLCKELEE